MGCMNTLEEYEVPQVAKIRGLKATVVASFSGTKRTFINRCGDFEMACGYLLMRKCSLDQINEKWLPGKVKSEPVITSHADPIRFKFGSASNLLISCEGCLKLLF